MLAYGRPSLFTYTTSTVCPTSQDRILPSLKVRAEYRWDLRAFQLYQVTLRTFVEAHLRHFHLVKFVELGVHRVPDGLDVALRVHDVPGIDAVFTLAALECHHKAVQPTQYFADRVPEEITLRLIQVVHLGSIGLAVFMLA